MIALDVYCENCNGVKSRVAGVLVCVLCNTKPRTAPRRAIESCHKCDMPVANGYCLRCNLELRKDKPEWNRNYITTHAEADGGSINQGSRNIVPNDVYMDRSRYTMVSDSKDTVKDADAVCATRPPLVKMWCVMCTRGLSPGQPVCHHCGFEQTSDEFDSQDGEGYVEYRFKAQWNLAPEKAQERSALKFAARRIIEQHQMRWHEINQSYICMCCQAQVIPRESHDFALIRCPSIGAIYSIAGWYP